MVRIKAQRAAGCRRGHKWPRRSRRVRSSCRSGHEWPGLPRRSHRARSSCRLAPQTGTLRCTRATTSARRQRPARRRGSGSCSATRSGPFTFLPVRAPTSCRGCSTQRPRLRVRDSDAVQLRCGEGTSSLHTCAHTGSGDQLYNDNVWHGKEINRWVDVKDKAAMRATPLDQGQVRTSKRARTVPCERLLLHGLKRGE